MRLAGALVAAAALAVTAFAGVSPLLSPAAPAEDAVAGFSMDRARADLAVVAAVPHPMGTAEQADVEAYLVQELTAIGLDPMVDEQLVTMAPDPPNSVWTGTVRNVVARIEGTGPDADQAVLLAAHYDSVPAAAGAGDNGAGVVSVLAAMRALASSPPPRHDVIAAFVDGEEHEMLGSLALVESATWMGDVQVAVNTEGVGNAGRVTPALTSPDNGWALRQYLDAVPSPVVYSAFDAPLNATGQGADLGRYQDVVPAGLELVVVGGLPAYHAGTDTAGGMHEGTLAEYGATVVGLARQLAEADLGSVEEPNLVAFTVVRGVTAAYPSTWSLPLAVLGAVGTVVVIGLAVRRGRVSLPRVLLSWLVLGVAGLAGILAATGLWLAAQAVDPRLSDAINGGVYERTPYLLAAVAAGAAGVLLVLWPLTPRATALEVVAGALVGWSLVALLLAAVLPDAAYAATWPLLAAIAGFAVLAARERSPRVTLATVTLAAAPAVLLISPLVALYFLLAARFELMLPVATPLPMLWVVLALTVVLPLALVAGRGVGWRPAAAAGVVAVVLVAAGAALSAVSTGPRPDLLVYHADADTGTARWVALPVELDTYTGQVASSEWTETRFEASPFHQAGETEPASAAPAPEIPAGRLGTPRVSVTSDAATAQGRELAVQVTAPPGSYALTIDARSGAGIQSVAVNGKDVPAATTGAPSSVRVVAFGPQAGIPMTLTVPAGADVELALACYTLGLDGSPAVDLRPRPASLTTGVHELSDAVLVTTVARLPGPGTP
ncbi:M28 family peptidase [Fodinibacter luteus]|uniref:M28 family peptidase n=1 Tax=Fodinibacter luteus TaxID=552064 RepID=UPI0031ED2D0D